MTDNHQTAVTVVERGEVAEKMSPVVAAAMTILRENPSPEALDKLFQVQERWEANEARKRFAQALVDLKRDLPTVLKHDKVVDFESKTGGKTHFTHTTLASASDQLTPVLAQYGFAMTFMPSTGERTVTVKCQLRHSGGHVEEATMSAGIDTTGPMKNPAQQAMSSVTYLKRYLMLSMLGIATQDMKDLDDENHERKETSNPERIDTARNMRAVGKLKALGKSKEDAETFLGKRLPDWTVADLERLQQWAQPAEPPHDAATGEVPAELAEVLVAIERAQTDQQVWALKERVEALPPGKREAAKQAFAERRALLKQRREPGAEA